LILNGRKVIVNDGNWDRALKKFKKKIAETGVIDHLREREFYTKPTTERKLKASAARARWNKKLRDQALPPKLY
jgi:small subunit ribosomal protein S21